MKVYFRQVVVYLFFVNHNHFHFFILPPLKFIVNLAEIAALTRLDYTEIAPTRQVKQEESWNFNNKLFPLVNSVFVLSRIELPTISEGENYTLISIPNNNGILSLLDNLSQKDSNSESILHVLMLTIIDGVILNPLKGVVTITNRYSKCFCLNTCQWHNSAQIHLKLWPNIIEDASRVVILQDS